MRMRDFSLKLLTMFFSLALTLASAEVCLRVVGYAGDHERFLMSLASQYGDVPTDNWIFRLPEEPSSFFEINGENVPVETPEGEKRILFLGDSGTFGLGVGIGDSFPNQVGRRLQEIPSGCPFRTINAGVIGMTTVNELQVFEHHLRRLKPDVVVIGLFMANDINFNLRHEPDLFARKPSRRKQAVAWLRNHSALAHFSTLKMISINQRFKFLRARSEGRGVSDSQPLTLVDSEGYEFLNYLTGELALYRKHYSRLSEHAFELLAQVLATFKGLAIEDGFELKVLMIPTSSTIAGRIEMYYFPDALCELKRLNTGESDLDLDKPRRRVLEICRQLSIPCIDPIDALRKYPASQDIQAGDDHLTLLGHTILADELISHLSHDPLWYSVGHRADTQD